MVYVLLMVTSVDGGLCVHTQEFNSKEACHVAKEAFDKFVERQHPGYGSAICVPKGEPDLVDDLHKVVNRA